MYKEITSNKRNSVVLMMFFIAILIAFSFVINGLIGEQGSYAIVWFVIILSFFMTVISYFSGDKIALAYSGAKEIKREENLYVYRMVENLCIANGIPTPKIYIIEDTAINAFATGRKPELSSIAITRGAIEKLENEELEGVIAHEISHIKNYDILFMTLVAVLVGAIVLLSDIFLRGRFFKGGDDRKDGGLFLIIGIVLAILSPLIAELIKLAISRKREYLADASASLLTRYPAGLSGALEKIKLEDLQVKRASRATAPLFFANPFKNASSWFSTHPPIDSRIEKLKQMISN